LRNYLFTQTELKLLSPPRLRSKKQSTKLIIPDTANAVPEELGSKVPEHITGVVNEVPISGGIDITFGRTPKEGFSTCIVKITVSTPTAR